MTGAMGIGGRSGLVVPVGPLLIVGGVASLAGVAAALLPSRRAARIDILIAVAGA